VCGHATKGMKEWRPPPPAGSDTEVDSRDISMLASGAPSRALEIENPRGRIGEGAGGNYF